MKLKPEWLVGLPQVTGRWGFKVDTTVDSHVAVWHHGSMDTELFEQVIEFIVSLYPNVSRKIKRDENGRLLQGPILIKVDGGQGRVSKKFSNILFRRRMELMGVYIICGLPNSTAVTQEMDDFFRVFKAMCRMNTQKIFAEKTLQSSLAVQKKGEDGDNIVVSLSNSDLAYIVNGKQEDPVEERPFDCCFVLEKIFKSWMNVGLIPFTRKCMKHPKVRHLLGKGGSHEGEMQSKLQHLLVKYENIKQKVREAGLNADVFNAKIPVYKKNYLLQ